MFTENTFVGEVSEVYRRVGRPYLRTCTTKISFGEEETFFVTCSPATSFLFSQAEEFAIDATYNEIKEEGKTFYLLNTAFYCEILNRCKPPLSPLEQLHSLKSVFLSTGIPGPRCRMTRKTTEAYLEALNEIVDVVKRDVPSFSLQNFKTIATDFEEALVKAMSVKLGDIAAKRIMQGCEVLIIQKQQQQQQQQQ